MERNRLREESRMGLIALPGHAYTQCQQLRLPIQHLAAVGVDRCRPIEQVLMGRLQPLMLMSAWNRIARQEGIRDRLTAWLQRAEHHEGRPEGGHRRRQPYCEPSPGRHPPEPLPLLWLMDRNRRRTAGYVAQMIARSAAPHHDEDQV